MFEAAGPAYGAFIRAIQELIKRPVGYFLQDRAVNTLVVYAIIKGIVLLGGLFVVAVTREYRVISVSFPWVLTNWDGGWYTGIASNWYAYNYPYSAAFPPLYPLLIKALSFNQPTVISWAALLLSNAFSFVALYFLYKLAPMIVDQKYRLRICFAYMVFPVLIICNLVAYSEALFLATTIGAYYFWKRSKFGFAALLAVCSIFTRQVGAFILIIFVVDMVYGYSVRRNKSQAIQQLAVIAGTCLGVGALYLFYYVTFGDPFIVTRVEAANWQNSIALTHVVTNLKLSLIGIDTQSLYAPGPIPFPLIVISSAVLAATTFCMLRRDAALAVYSAASVLLFLLMSEAQKVPQSFLRFVAATFPIYLFFGLMLSNNWRKNVAVGVIAVLIAIENMYIWMSGAWLY